MLLVSSRDASFVFQCFVGLGPRCTEVLRDLRASGPEIWAYGPKMEAGRPIFGATLFAPAIQNGVGYGIANCLVTHGPLKLVNAVVVLLLKFPFHRIGYFCGGNLPSNS